MPVIARFYNIIIKMYYIEDEHEPPHIHAKYNEYEAIFNIKTGNISYGYLPNRYERLVKRFLKQYKERLIEMWIDQNFEELKYED